MIFYTYEQLKDKLNDDNKIKIINDDFAIHSFKIYGYFDLVNNYKSDVKQVQENQELTIDDLLAIREIDNDLQSLIFKYLIQIENTFKSHLSYLMGQEFGVNKADYTNPDNYETKISSERVFSKIEEKDHIDFTRDPAKHYLDKYSDIPPWVFLKHIPLGDTKNIYKELKNDHKNYIVNEMVPFLKSVSENDKLQCFKEHMDFIHEFRNTIAHGGRLLNYKTVTKVQPKNYTNLFSKTVIPINKIYKYERRIYQLLLSIILLINDSYLRGKFIAEVESLYKFFTQSRGNHFSDIFLEVSGLPNDFIYKLKQSVRDLSTTS
ncbi:Abi family protein [Salinicoccus sp. ID82-1]|uniref:Abi family protein n=1 Tax=Salinicoccus sp. ID82-1 TaxID=2820269 RepID=UPI001F2F77A8|nr:Abi family protein [Salinicoccus sp. ID82-1]MCG1009265.1 Abi family protein [Salinicoccus sp. ID82-1]